MNSSKNRTGWGRSSKNNGYWTKNRIHIYTHSALYALYIRLQVTLYIYKIELKANPLYIETKNNDTPSKNKTRYQSKNRTKNRRYWTKNRLGPYPRHTVRLRTSRPF